MLAMSPIRSHLHSNSRWCHASGGTPTLTHFDRDTGVMVDNILLFMRSPSAISYERIMDPMLLETHLMNQRHGNS
jgi:hypothetical protein